MIRNYMMKSGTNFLNTLYIGMVGKISHARTKKILSEGVHFDFVFSLMRGGRIQIPQIPHLNGVSLAGR